MSKMMDKIPIIITLPKHGIQLKGIAMISTIHKNDKDEEVGIEYTIPNMHINLQNGEVVEKFDANLCRKTYGVIGSGDWYIEKPLVEVIESEVNK